MHLGAVRGHKLSTIWEDTVAPKIYALLDEMGLNWSIAHIVHYMEFGEPCSPAYLLKEFDITTIDVQIGEAITWH